MNLENKNIDSKSRLVGAMENATYEEAEAKLNRLTMLIVCDKSIQNSPSQQAALLTSINTGKRCFKGGIFVIIPDNINLLLPWERETSLPKAIEDLGGHIIDNYDTSDFSFVLYFGTSAKEEHSLEVVSDSWRGGILKNAVFIKSDDSLPLGGILAGSLAVGKAFLFVTNKNTSSVLENTVVSLWNSENIDDLPKPITALPQNLWLLGLGHLGQAYLWTLSMLPFKDPSEVMIQLQDFDKASVSNWESSVLTEKKFIGKRKTRICSEWIEKRGFETTIIERAFDSTCKKQKDEPGILLSGLDNVATRLDIDPSQFSLVIDCGLGGDVSSFDHLIMRVLPNLPKKPNEIWQKQEQPIKASKSLSTMYENAFGCGYDDKGISTSFVGVFASCWVMAELIKAYNYGRKSQIVSCTMRDFNDSFKHVQSTTYDYQLAVEGFSHVV